MFLRGLFIFGVIIIALVVLGIISLQKILFFSFTMKSKLDEDNMEHNFDQLHLEQSAKRLWKQISGVSGTLKNRQDNLETRTVQKTSKLVLIYTPLFGRFPWPGLETSHNFTHFRGKACEVTNCRITYDKKDLPSSDVVIFHGRDMPSVNTMKEMSRNRTRNQRWVYFMHENPYFTYDNPALYNGFFNWTMTYRRDSEFFVPYNYYSPLTSTEKQAIKIANNYAEGKDKFIAWMVGHCGKQRDQVTAKLLRYVNVTVFGGCQHKFGQSNRCDRRSAECDELLKRFKFYLSFENANCIDYVTEKYWYTPFRHDMVPIVLGPPKYDSKIAIPGSYINVMDFSSLEALANYLKYLDKNDTAYSEYFQWKLKYKIDYPNPWNCQMCADLNNPNLPVKIYDDLDSFWGINSSCVRYENKVRELLKR